MKINSHGTTPIHAHYSAMIILSLYQGGHDSSVTVADDYDILSAIHTERITRKKGDGQYPHQPTIDAAK